MDSEKSFLKQFLTCYRNHPPLWDSTSPDYMVKSKKIPGYKELRHIYRKYKADATIDDVKKKINSLRCSYRREYKKRMQFEMCGAGIDETSRPTLWWYPMMTFLNFDNNMTETFFKVDLNCDEMSESFVDEQITSEDLKTFANNEDISTEDLKTFYHDPTYDDEQKVSTDEGFCIDEHHIGKKRSRTPKQSMLVAPRKIKKLEDKESHLESRPLDTFDYMARTWADKLRNMENIQRIIAEKGVNDILFEGEMGTLTRDSIQIRSEYPSEYSQVG